MARHIALSREKAPQSIDATSMRDIRAEDVENKKWGKTHERLKTGAWLVATEHVCTRNKLPIL